MILHHPESSAAARLQPSPAQPSQGAYRLAVIAAAIFLAVWSVSYVIRGIAAGVWFDGSPSDGPFSMFNALRRIDAGQTLGLDVRSYLGVGVPLLHYPMFVALGRTIVASEITRHLLAFLSYLVPLIAFFYAACRSVRITLLLTTISTLALEAFFHNVAGPANSMIVVRAMMPLFIFSIWLSDIRDSVKAATIGFGVALAFLFGFEQSIAFTIAFTVAALVKAILSRGKGTATTDLKFLVIALGSAAVGSAVLLLGLCGQRGARAVLQFFLVDLPADKFWYDGSPPNPFLGAWKELVTSRHHLFPFLPAIVAVVILCIVLPRVRLAGAAMARDWRVIALVMLGYGIMSSVSLLGMLGIHYTVPLCRVLVLVALLAAVKHPLSLKTASAGLRSAIPYAFSAVCLGAAIFAVVPAMAATKHPTYTPVYGPNLSPAWDRYMADATRIIDTNRERPGPVSLWSTYAGLLESHYDVFDPAADYLVVEVGAERRARYFSEFARIQPEFVQTFAPLFFVYEEWLQNVDWPFYEAVLNNYRIVGATERSFLWRRTATPWTSTNVPAESLHVDASGRCIPIPASRNDERVGIVALRYSVHNSWSRFPLLGMTPRYLVTPEGTPRHIPVSLPPYQRELRFAVELPLGKSIRLGLDTKSLLPNAGFAVDGVSIQRLPWNQDQRAILVP